MPRRALLSLVLLGLLSAPHASAAERVVRFDPGATSRRALAARLDRAGLDVRVLRRLPFAAVRGDRRALRRALRARGVVASWPNRRIAFHLHESAPLAFGGPAPRAAALGDGLDGRGVTVAVVDSGTDGLHPDLRGRVVRNVKVLGTDGIATDGVFHTYVECPVACTTDTSGGHGTHVSGIAVGDGTASDGYYTGMAPGASLVGISVGDAVAIFHALEAYDYLLEHQRELGVVAVNNSFGPSGGGRFDAADPMNVATKALHDAGMIPVFSAGNSGSGPGTDPEGASDCSASGADDACKINPWGVAPWAVSVANTRKDAPGGPGDQPLNLGSSRGDPTPRRSLDGAYTISYQPTLSAPGTNIRAARALNGVAGLTCGASAEAPSCVPPKPDAEAWYAPLSGTSMAAPHVVGAIAVIQGAAQARVGRRLTPDEVRSLLVDTAAPMTLKDGLYDFPCGALPGLECGVDASGLTGQPYAPWQVGAGALDVGAALAEVTPRRFHPRPRRQAPGS